MRSSTVIGVSGGRTRNTSGSTSPSTTNADCGQQSAFADQRTTPPQQTHNSTLEKHRRHTTAPRRQRCSSTTAQRGRTSSDDCRSSCRRPRQHTASRHGQRNTTFNYQLASQLRRQDRRTTRTAVDSVNTPTPTQRTILLFPIDHAELFPAALPLFSFFFSHTQPWRRRGAPFQEALSRWMQLMMSVK